MDDLLVLLHREYSGEVMVTLESGLDITLHASKETGYPQMLPQGAAEDLFLVNIFEEAVRSTLNTLGELKTAF